MAITVTQEVEIVEGEELIEIIDVEFEGRFHWEDDRFSYSYGSIDGVAGDGPYPVCEQITWNKKDYTQQQNDAVQKYLDEYYDDVANDLCRRYESFNDNY